MKDLDSMFKEHANLEFPDKNRLYKLYEEKAHVLFVSKRLIAFTLSAAVLAVGTTAIAAGRDDNWMNLRNIISQDGYNIGLSDQKIDDIADRLDNVGVSTDDIADEGLNMQANSYGETIGHLYSAADLQIVASYSQPEVTGYVYRYDLGIHNSSLYLLPEEQDQMELDGVRTRMLSADPVNGNILNWVYVYDENGTTVLGKMEIDDFRFRTNEELEDPEINKDFLESAGADEYDGFTRTRTQFKTETGTEFAVGKAYIRADIPEEGFDWHGAVVGYIPEILSENATAVSSDPDMIEIDEIVTYGENTDTPCTQVIGHVYKTGTCTITVTDGDKEYIFERSTVIGRHTYEHYERQVN